MRRRHVGVTVAHVVDLDHRRGDDLAGGKLLARIQPPGFDAARFQIVVVRLADKGRDKTLRHGCSYSLPATNVWMRVPATNVWMRWPATNVVTR